MKKFILSLCFLAFAISVSLAQFSKIYDFPAENDLAYSGYSQPVFDGVWFYDVTTGGGLNGLGCIFKIKPDGTGYSKVMDFDGATSGSNHFGSLTLSNSILYGMTYGGGANDQGVIYKVNTDGTGFKKLLDFNWANGAYSRGSLTLSGSVLFGMTSFGGVNGSGTIFKINIDGTGYAKLLDFSGITNGSTPYGSLSISGSVLFGMTCEGGTNNCGTIFKINTNGTGYTKLLDFDGTTKGGYPYGSLTISGSVLYGTTRGGNNDLGSIFKINTDGTGYSKLLDFNTSSYFGHPMGSLTISSSFLYGTTSFGGSSGYGNIFKINIDGTGYTNLLSFEGVANGSCPNGSLTLLGSTLYGTTINGGIMERGVMFKINIDGSSFSKILDYNKTTSSGIPFGSLTLSGSTMYGMTQFGGSYGLGTIFKIGIDGTSYTKMMDFDGLSNGSKPYGNLLVCGSVMYGMTSFGGTNNKGTIFKINLDGSGYTKLFDFNNPINGCYPHGSLTFSGTVLFGTTFSGGNNGCGTIFKIGIDGTGYTKLLDFDGVNNGNSPFCTLTLIESVLYGMTTSGGVNNKGTIFKINTDGSGYTKLLDFDGISNGSSPYGSLIVSGSYLYGMTNSEGANYRGTIFKIRTDGSEYTKLLDFDGISNGSFPYGSLIVSGSNLYGMTNSGGVKSSGTLFKVCTDGSGFVKLHDFCKNDGTNPYSDLIQNGNILYGMTNTGGSMGIGAIFKYELITPTAPILGSITQPSCTVGTGSVVLNNLPTSGTWILTRTPGGVTTTGTGVSAAISGLPTGSFTFTVTNALGGTSPVSASVVILPNATSPAIPTIGKITQPTCTISTGGVILSGLPSTGTWKLTRTPSGIISAGSGASTTITGLVAGTYTYTVTNASGCTSAVSENVVINVQPVTPTAPTLRTIIQPTCSTSTGSIALGGLPNTGSWTLIRTPGGETTTGVGANTTISSLTAGSYAYTVTSSSGCTSAASANVVINAQPAVPTSPIVGTITQPNIVEATGSVVLRGLPSIGTWTLVRMPGGLVTTGTGTNIALIGLTAGIYTYTVTNSSGCTSMPSSNIVINPQPTTGIDNGNSQAANYLGQNFPNPFDYSTTIEFSVVKPSHVKLSVYSALGKEVDVIVNEFLANGTYTKCWEPKNLPNGIYYYQLKVEGFKATRRMIILK